MTAAAAEPARDWSGFEPLELDVDCGGDRHTLRWEAGDLLLRDHDREGESVLAALGGGEPACVEVADAWQVLGTSAGRPLWRCITETGPSLADLAARPLPSAWREQVEWAMDLDNLTGHASTTSSRVRASRRPSPGGRGARDLYGRHLDVLAYSLPDEWVTVRTAARLWDFDAWEALGATSRDWARGALTALVFRVLVTCDSRMPTPPTVKIGEWSAARANPERVAVTPWWFARVFARGAGVIEGCFVLDLVAHPDGDGRFVAERLTVSPRNRVAVQPSIVHRTPEGWRVG
jgi:hypothetical protein